MRVAVAVAAAAWIGAALVLSELPWFRRPPVTTRLYPFVLRPVAGQPRRAAASFREAFEPLARAVGARLSRVLGVDEDLALRLERLHSPLDVTAFRVRQIGWATLAFGTGSAAVIAVGAPPPVALLLIAGSPLLAFLVLEHHVAVASERWQQRVFTELPVVAEQLATLLSAGYSLGGALNRVAARGRGACAAELERVCVRIRQGLTEKEALLEWDARAGVDALGRLVAVLALEREATDLGRLIENEASNVRSEVHRRAVEVMERRGQQVWIPVTVAALVPGVIFMAIPFIDALRVFSGP